MKLQLIRNATMKIDYGGKSWLTDPMLCGTGALFSIAGIAPNPTFDLPFSAEKVVAGTDCLLVSHDHPDHFDKTAAAQLIPRSVPLFCQPGEETRRRREGFENVIPIETSYEWGETTVTRRDGRHGIGPALAVMGAVSGYVLRAEKEPTVYWVGDSVWCEEVEHTIGEFSPDVIVTHSGGGYIPGLGRVTMNGEETLRTLYAAPRNAIVVAVHMDAMDHCRVCRQSLRRIADKAGIPVWQLVIPEDGEAVVL